MRLQKGKKPEDGTVVRITTQAGWVETSLGRSYWSKPEMGPAWLHPWAQLIRLTELQSGYAKQTEREPGTPVPARHVPGARNKAVPCRIKEGFFLS